MPPLTPRTTCRSLIRPGRSDLRLELLEGQRVLVDLTQSHRERLLLHVGRDERADVLEKTLTELRVVGVDLPGALRRVDDERVLALDLVEQLVDGRVGDALGIGGGAGHALPLSRAFVIAVQATSQPARIRLTSCSAASSTDVLTIVASNSSSAASSICAVASRAWTTSADSVPRPRRRRSSSSHVGGARNTSSASGISWRTWRAPCTSISSSTASPAASRSSTGRRGVPYQLPAYCACSSSSPSRSIRPNSSPSTKNRSSPSTSPARAGRVVALTECQLSGCLSRRYARTELLPTPAGPDRTVSRAGRLKTLCASNRLGRS